jgi:hypothetical protein
MTTTLDHILQLWPQTPTTGPSPRDIPNVDRWHSLTQLFHDLNFTKGAEIGTERGLFAKRICVSNPGVKLYCIDPWLAYKGYRDYVSQSKLDDFYETARERLAPYDCELVRKFSVDASRDFEDGSLDFIYIDANHNLLSVIQDLHYWTPKVRSGGIVAGHDMIKRKNPSVGMHVVQAVYAFTDAYNIDPWYILGRKEKVEGELREKQRSFMWVKQ